MSADAAVLDDIDIDDIDIDDVDVDDPERYVAGPQHDVFARLQRVAPVYRQEMPDGTAYWAVLRRRMRSNLNNALKALPVRLSS